MSQKLGFPVPSNEPDRLAALRSLNILDTLPDEHFDRIVRMALAHYRTPVVRITFVDEDRVWFKARVGMNADQAPRSISFCAYTIMSDDVLVAPDLTADPRFANSPQVAGKPHFRFYAAAPILVKGGLRIGSVCLMDYVPHPDFSDDDAAFLQELAGVVVDELDLHEKIIEHKRIEEDLRKTEQQLSDAIECIPGGFALFDSEDRFTHFNSKFSFDQPPVIFRPKVGLTFEEFIREREKLGIQFILASGKKLSVEERLERHRNPAGPMETPSRDGRILQTEEFKTSNGGTGIIRLDITDIKKAAQKSEAALRQAQKMEAVGQLTGGVAHDFNNLLAVISGTTELLHDEIGDHHLLATVSRATKRGAELTQRLLAFSRQQALNPQSIDLTELIAGLHDLLHRTLGEPVEILTDVPEGVWPVTADPGQLENALLNLAINARDAMAHGGILEIRCSNVEIQEGDNRVGVEAAAGNYVQIAVRDTGTGMPEDLLEHVFEPFYSTKDVGQGSGLGLSMVYGFARQSGGDVVIESEPGKGTEVRLFLPHAETKEPSRERARKVEDLKHGQGETILVLEDDPDVRDLVVASLDRLGYRVLEAADANAAMAVLEAEKDTIVLLLSDVVLPGGVSGPELATKAKDLYPKMKIVFMTGYAPDHQAIDKISDIGEALLSKPFNRADLAKAIDDAVTR